MQKPSIGFFLSSVQDMGGAIRVAVSLANRMCNDYDVTIIERMGHERLAFPVDCRVKLVSLDCPAERFREQITAVRKPLETVLRTLDIDVLFGICVEETAMAIAPCRATHTKIVFCDHGALVNQLDDKTTTLLRYTNALLANKTVVLTNQSADDYARLFHTSKGKLRVIANWIPDELIHQAKRCDVNAKRLLWAGRLDHEKGIDHLFEIARRVMPLHPDWTWDVWGASVIDTEGFDLAGELAKEGLDAQVRLKGCYANTQDVFPNYSLATLTSYREGLPLFLLEGMAYGLPLLSFDVDTGPRDLIEPAKNGFLAPSYDCDEYAALLCALMESVEARQVLSDGSLASAQAFSESAIYPQWVALINELYPQQQGVDQA